MRWQPWGTAALDRARREDKPVLLAVGSFSPHSVRVAHIALDATADPINNRYVPVLIDRAEWPLIASAYAGAAGRIDSFDLVLYALTPDLELLEVVDASTLIRVADRWKTDRAAYLEEARIPVRIRRVQRPTAAKAADVDLDLLPRSVLHDLLGGGFHRDCRDAECTMPLFDKTLDDQANAARRFLDASRFEVARSTLEYAVRDMQLSAGPFNASQEADSLVPVGRPVIEDGAYYVWDRAEIVHTFGKIGEQICERFGVPDHGKGILRPVKLEPPSPALAAAIAKMLEIRLHRPMPLRDDAITESSARMIGQLARGAMILDEPRFLRAAERGMTAIAFDKKTSRLSRRPGVPATPSDYGAVVSAAIEVYEATLDVKWLDFALRLQSIRDERALLAVPEPVRDFIKADFNPDPRLDAITGSAPSTLARVVIYGSPYRTDTHQLHRAAYQNGDRDRVVVFGGKSQNPDGSASATICRSAGCSKPFSDPQALAAALRTAG